MDIDHGDSFAGCEHGQCRHDLARAVTVAELLAADGPFGYGRVLELAAVRPARFDDDEAPAELRRWAV